MVPHEWSQRENKFCAPGSWKEYIDTEWSFDRGEGSQACHNISRSFKALEGRTLLTPAVDGKQCCLNLSTFIKLKRNYI